MLPDPLHPAVVHFPIVLMFLLPVAAVAALWLIRNGARVSRAWTLVLAAAAALAASAWLAVETGESDEEAVERVVAEAPIGRHEEAAERFLLLAGGMVVLAGLGLVRGPVGAGARLATMVGALGLAAAGVAVGHSGGELVYRHGAAAAHVAGGGAETASGAELGRAADHDDD
jgi:uncharacterized membrane protein